MNCRASVVKIDLVSLVKIFTKYIAFELNTWLFLQVLSDLRVVLDCKDPEVSDYFYHVCRYLSHLFVRFSADLKLCFLAKLAYAYVRSFEIVACLFRKGACAISRNAVVV